MLQFHHPGRVFQERPLTSGYLTETRWVDISHSWDKWIWQLTWTKVLLSEGCWSEVILTHWMLRKLRGSGASHYYINVIVTIIIHILLVTSKEHTQITQPRNGRAGLQTQWSSYRSSTITHFVMEGGNEWMPACTQKSCRWILTCGFIMAAGRACQYHTQLPSKHGHRNHASHTPPLHPHPDPGLVFQRGKVRGKVDVFLVWPCTWGTRDKAEPHARVTGGLPVGSTALPAAEQSWVLVLWRHPKRAHNFTPNLKFS